MSVKRKISVRKIIQALLTIVLAGVCITAVSSATKLHKTRKLSEVEIQIKNDKYGFVTEHDIMQTLIEEEGIREHESIVSALDVQKMEDGLINNPWVGGAEVFVDNNSKLHALVTQRVPVVRIFEKGGASYYLDEQSDSLALSTKYNYYAPVVTNVPRLTNDSASDVLKERILKLTNFISNDKFWSAQVSQVIVMDDRRFEIVPVLGEHRIIIGDTNDLQKKFDNLLSFYKKVLNNIGWDRYELLDLSYKGQLVASPAVNWNLPVDKTIKRINWVESILGEPVYYQTFSNASPAVPKVVKTALPADSVSINKIETAKPEQTVINTTEKKEVKEKAEVKKEEPADKPTETKKPTSPKKSELKKEEKKQPKYIYGGN